MKRYLFVALALVVLLVAPVSASWSTANIDTYNSTVFTTPIINHINFTLENPATICAQNGLGVFAGREDWIRLFYNHLAPADYVGAASQEWHYETEIFHYGTGDGTVNISQTDSPLYLTVGQLAYCGGSGTGQIQYLRYFYNDTAYQPVPVASFTCTPTSQYPDEPVVCTDTSTNAPSEWLWTIDAEGMGIDGWLTGTSRNYTWYSHYPGLYSVNLKATNGGGFDWENKSSYVSISDNATPNNCDIPPLAGYSRTSFQCTDSMSSSAIIGCNIQLHDLEGGSWSNGTNTDGVWCIDTLPAHHINGYGQSTGYTDGSRLNVEEWNGQTYTILMIPGYVPPAATGYVWVYVHVTDWSGSQDIPGAYVSLSGSGLTTKSDTTDASGVVHLQWPNVTTAYINVVKPGYTSGIEVITTSDFGPDMVHITLHKGTQTMTIVPTTGPGGTVPTTASPWGTPGPGGTMPPGYTNSQGQAMMDLLASNGYGLVLLCILVTMMALIKMIAK